VAVRAGPDNSRIDRDSLKTLLEQGLSLEKIGRRFGRDPSTIGYWVKKHGLEAVHRDKHLGKGGIAKRDLERLIARGYAVARIAAELGRSESSVLYWLRKHGLRTHVSERRRAAEEAKRQGQATVQLRCRHHGLTDFFIEGRGYYRCLRCRWEAVSRRRRKVKEILVHEAGGACRLCGYERCISALQFHHLDRAQKAFTVSHRGHTRSIATLREEASKCVLLCANCHAEVEAGVAVIPG
jgi:transposase-like protein